MKRMLIAGAACLIAAALPGRDAPEWLSRGIVAPVPAGETAKIPLLAKRGVTIVYVTNGTNDAFVAASTAAAKAEGLKVIVDVALPAGEMDVTAWAATNAIPRLVGEVADGWRLTGGKWDVSWNGLEMLRQAVDSLKPGFALVSDNPRLGNQRVVYDVDTPAPWNSTLDSVLKRKKPVTELADLWKFMRANRPEGARFLRYPLHWDVMPIAFSMCLDGVPTFSPGQALASCSKDVLPQFAALRAKEAAFVEGELEWLANDQPEKVASFMRVAPDGRRIVCVFNIGKEPLSVKVSFAGQPAVEPLAATGCTFKDGVYTFTGPGFDVRATSCDAPAISAERTARERAVAAAKLPRAQELVMKDPVYPHCGPKGSDYSVCTARDVPGYLKGSVMYQLFLRMFTPEGTLKAAERRLEFVRSLGTDIIYLCPVATSDRGTDRKFWSGRQKSSQMDNPCNPYRVSDYFGIDPEYGTEQDLRDFVDAAHRLGMKVYFDLVYYHCGPNAVFLKEHPEWVLREPDGSFTLGQWAFPRLDVKNPEVREYLFENMKWYLTEFACDGFRCDVGGMLPLWYREEAYRRNKAVKDDVVMMCEGSDPREQQVAFDLCYAFPMQHAIGAFLSGKGSATNLSVQCANKEARFPKGYHWMRCFQNHDYANCNPGGMRWEKRYGININDGLLATIFTLDGVPMVYNGQEIADTAPHSIWSNRDHGKWGIDWSAAATPEGTHRLSLVKELARLRHEHPSFFDAPTEWLDTSCPDDVYAFRRPLSDGTSWITAVNISTNDHAITVPAGHAARLAGPGATLDSVSGRLVLPARSWLVAANGPFPLVRIPHSGKGLAGHFHPTYASAHDATTTSARSVPPFLRGSVMYQLFTRMFTPEGTFAAARAKLKDLKADGVDVVYLTPHQLADDDPDPRFWSGRQKACKLNNPKNPYRQKDFFAVDPEYGTKEDLKAFVDEAHRLGMKVMFDLVYFHCGPKAVFLKDHPDFIVRNPDGSPKLGDWAFPEMDIANPAVREYLYSNMVGFVRDYGADGFRCDVADMLPVDFWEEGARRCRAVKSDVFLMCEGLKGDDQIEAFDLTYGFYTQWTMVSMLEGKSPASMLEKAWRAQVCDYPRGFHWMRCFENHDFANVNPGQKRKETLYGHELNAAMIATCFLLDGIPMLYNGQEIADASPHSIYANRDHGKWCIDWSRAGDPAAVERRALVRRLTALRHAHPDLFDAPVVWHAVPEPDKVYAFSRPLPDGTTFTLAVNISREPVSFALSGGRKTTLAPRGFDLTVQSAAPAPCTLMVNEDNDHYFLQDASKMTREDLRAYVDSIIDGGKVSEIVFCPCGQPANWNSSAWEPIWKRLDEFPEAYRKNPAWRTWPANLKLLHDRGIDPYQVWLARCRERGVGGWLSMRMNDVHFTTHKILYVRRTVAFWRDHPELRRHPERDPFAGGHEGHLRWKDFALDYSKPAVYAYSLAMAKELIERYAPDGLELDWMRYVTHLTPGKEREQSHVLTSFMRDVRKLADAEGAKRGRRIALSVRLPSRYANARALGYDPETWARDGLCDLFIPCNKDSADFACDVADWKRRLAPAKVIPGIDRLDCAGGEKVYADFCGYLGWADAMRARGAEGLYLFNAPYLPEAVKGAIWRKGLEADVARQNGRRYIASYADSAPDEQDERELPQMPWPLAYPRPLDIPLGTVLPSDSISVVVAFDTVPPDGLDVRLNGIRAASCERLSSFGKAYGDPKHVKAACRWIYPCGILDGGGTAKVEIAAVPGCMAKAMWCEIDVNF